MYDITHIMRSNILEKNQPVHIISRAVEERKIFDNEVDCLRFIYQLYAANNGSPVHTLWRQDIIKIIQAILNGEEIPSRFIFQKHPPLVDFLDFALVINHSHFYLVPRVDNGVSLFMKKLNTGFAKYFNLKYGRKGALFGSRYRAIVIKNQFQSDAVSRYVSIINPLDVFQSGWRENGLENKEDALKFLGDYQFSSFPDKIGKRKSKILASPEILAKYVTMDSANMNDYKEFVEDFLNQRSYIPQGLFLE